MIALLAVCMLLANANALKVNYITPRYAGTGGGTYLTIVGSDFRFEDPDFATGASHAETRVVFVDSHSEYECDVEKDASSNEKILCFTRRMSPSRYYVKVIAGDKVAYNQNCNGYPTASSCTLRVYNHHTPEMRRVAKVEPIQYPESKAYSPGDLIQVYGRLFTEAFGSNNQTDNGRGVSFRRVHINGYSCQLLNPSTQDFYHMKLTYETSVYGTFHCKTQGTFVGYSNVSFIITGIYGRSVASKSLYKVSATDTVHMIQTYADVTGVSPKVGSTEGGTKLTITGKHFDKDAKVLVGGVPCRLTNDRVTPTSLTCITGPASHEKPFRYAGSRGIHMKYWNGTRVGSSQLENIFKLNGSESDYQGRHVIQQAGYTWDLAHDFVATFEGIFVAPVTDRYKFYFKSDDAGTAHFYCGERMENKTFTILSTRYRPSYFYSHLQSPWLDLTKGQQCYFKTAVVDWGSQGNKYIAVLRQKTKLTRSQSYEVFNEKQLIDFEALKLAEKQKISLNTWATQSGVEEQQTVQVICTRTCTNSYFRLIYNGGKTPYMSFLVSRSAFTKELSSIVGVSGVIIQVSKSDISNGKQFVITFKGKGADYPLLGKEIRSSENMQVTVRETVKGVPDFKTFSLNLAGRTTAPIAFNATAAVLQEELFKLTSAHCSETLLPSGTSSRVLATFNFEDGSITEGLSGDIKQEVGGFCGRRSLKNPYYLFKAGTTSHLSWGKHRAFSMLSYPKLCFAHRGVFRPQIGINGVFQYTDNLGASKSQSTTKISAVTLSMSKNTWGYSCFDFATLLTTHYATLTTASIEEIYLYKIGDFYVDAVYIGKDNLLAGGVHGSDLRVPPALAAGEAIASVSVVKNEPNADYDVTIETFNCGHMVPLLKLPYATPSSTSGSKVEHRWQNGNNMTIQRLVEATPPMSGTFDLTHTSDEGVVETLKNIQVNITESRFKNLLESLNGFGQAKVSRSGSCHEIDYTIEWLTNGGSKSLLQINTTNIVGAPDLVGEVKKTTYGGVFHDPIPGEMLRLAYTKPQVEVTINGIPSYCRGDCEFEYKAESTPVVQSFSPNIGSWNTAVTIIGEKFGTPATANVSVHIGRANCTVTQHTDAQLQCEIDKGTAGQYELSVIISGLGKAMFNATISRKFNVSATIQSIAPVTGFTSGGALLNITGTGFGPNSEVYVGDKQCMRKKDARYSSTHLACILPPHAAGTVAVTVKYGYGGMVVFPASFTYSDASLPIISAIAPTTSTVIGGQSLNITGSNFGSSISDVKITIAGKDCAISSWSTTFLQCSLPSAPPGVHPVNVLVAETGIADLTQNNISGITYTFQVDGISPQHGSIYGGSMLTITGSGFVNDPSLNISIGNQAQCTVQSVSNNRVTCKVGSLAKTHLITNDGIHTVYGRGFAWTPQVLRIYVGDSVTWRWRVSGTSNGWGIRVYSTSTPDATEYDNKGFNSGATKTQMGWYQYKFTKPGVYYSFSGYLDSGSTVWMRGTIRVMEKMQYFPVRVMLKGYSPKSVGSSAPRSKRSSSCSVLDKVAGCVPSNVNGSLTFVSGDPCYTPIISTTSPQSGTIDTVLTITGTGFAPDNCANSVMIGDYPCDVISSTTTEIKCMPKPTNMTLLGTLYKFKVTVNNLGEASVDDNHRFALVPNINAVTPASGSLAGGTTLSVTGFGFNTLSQLNAISISGTPCVVKQSTAFQLTCVTSSVNAEISGNVTLFRTPYTSTCTGACLFSYLNAMTPTVTAISPNIVNQSDTTITLTGTGLTNDKMAVSVLVGTDPCAVISSTTTSIQCTLAHLPAGTHNVKVLIQPYGYAVFNPTSINTISSTPVVSLTPTSGSTEGGTVVTFNGNGFLVEGFLVLMDGRPCTITPPLTNNKFTCVTSKSFSTLVDVTFNPPSFLTLKYLYTNELTPVVTAIQPTGGTTGDVVMLTGRRLNSTNINVTIGESLCSITFMNYSHIECTVPSHRGGTFPVKVYDSVAGLGASNLLFTFVFNTTSVAPLSGGFAGGYKLTLTGSGYDSLMRIKVCDNFCFINASAPVSRTSVECTVETEPISSQLKRRATILHEATHHGESAVLTVLAHDDLNIKNGYFPLGQIVLNNSDTNENRKDIQAFKGVTSNAFKHPLSFTRISSKRNSKRQYISWWTPVAPEGYACLGDVLKHGSYSVPPNINSIFCPHLSLVVETKLGPKIWKTSSGNNLLEAWRIQGSRYNVYTTKYRLTSQIQAYRLKGVNEITAFNVDKVCPISIMLGAISMYSPSNFTYAATKTPIVQSLSPVRGGTGGGVNVTITGTGFVIDKSLVKVTIAGVPCTVLSSSLTTIMCQTEYSARSISSLVEVNIIGKGMAINTNAVFQYVDLWSSIYTWGGLPPPTAGDLVVIKAGQTVVLDVNTPIFKLLLIQGGTLIFDEKDLELQAEYILITNGGTLQIGTEEKHFEHKAIITLHGHLRAKELPIYGAKVLGVRNGTLDMHGRHIPITWTHLTQTSNVGDNTVHLKHAVNWNVGDEIVIATTGHRHSQKETETAKITSVSSNNKTLTLDKQLKYEHLCVVQTFTGSVTVETCAEVGLLTRNIVFRGSDNQEWHDVIPACPEGFDTGEFATQTCFQGRFGEEEGSDEFGAVMMIHQRHPSSNTARARIEFVEFSHVGQAFRLGRYPIHFHLMGDASRDNYVRGCAIHKSFNRAVTIHGTNNLLVEHNVIYNIKGGAVFIEDGVEYGNVLQYNVVVFCKQSTSLQNDDITPAAFWVTNANNTVQHNAAAGGTHFGFWYRMRHRPDGPSYDPSICPRQIPLGVFQNNTVHSQGWFGLWTFQIFYPKKGGLCWATEPEPATFDSLTTWNCEKGAELVNAGAIKFNNCIMLNNELAGIETKQIGDRNVKWGQAGIYNSVIISHGDVSKPRERTNSGVVLPFSEAWLHNNVTFINFDQSTSAALAGTSIAGTCSGLCGGFPYRMSGLKFINSPNKARFRWEHEMVIYDLDGTLTGTNSPGVVTPTNPSLPTSCVVNAAFSIGESGSVCPGGMKFHRVAWNKPIPSSLEAKNVTLTSQYGTTIIHYRKKRMTHKPGWMATVVGGESYRWTFVNAEQITNISYMAGFYDFESSDCVIISHKFTQKPDNVQIYQSVARNTTNQMVTCAANKNGEYFFDANLKELHYVVSGSDPVSKRSANPNAKDRYVKFNAFRCFYKDCIIPEPTGNNSKELARERPANAVFWSNVNSWRDADEGWGGNDGNGAFSLPKNGSKIKIKSGVWMVADINFPTMTELHVEGTLELDGDAVNGAYKTFNLEATYIIITGRFIVGWEDNTFLGQANIILKGDINTPEYRPSPQVTLGSKAIGVFGGLDLHGKRRDIVWTKLAKETGVDKSTITLKQAVDWLPGEEIVLTTTSFDPWETETFKIRSVSADKRTLTLNTTTKFTHLAHTVQYTDHAGTLKSYSIAADVGLLSRNIKIIGQDYNNLYKESFGARMLVGSYQNRTGTEFRGFARIEDVEIYHGGQEGHIDSYDPRYALAFLRSGTVDKDYFPSYVRRMSAHHCFNTAIGVFGAKGLPITNNVIHHTVGPGIRVEGENQRVENNLVTIARTRSVYQDRNEIDIILWKAAIEINEGTGTVMSGNVVAGSERAGYRIDGDECSTSVNSALEANEARAVMQGVWMNKDGFPSCSRINNFHIHKAFEVGIYTQVTGNIEIENALVTDSTLGVVNLFIGPPSKTHAYAAKHASIKKSTIVAVSKPGDCEIIPFSTDYIKNSGFARAPAMTTRTGTKDGRAGIAFPIFMSGHNAAPQKPHCGSISYSALGGRTDISETTFVNFDDTDCTRDRHTVFMTNPAGEDFMHPIYTQSLHFVNSSRDSRVFLHRPSLGKINPSDCVDMECDGMKTVLMVDKDGSFLGSPGTIIPEAEFEWDGDRKRGLGDYRIPKTMLTRLNGSRIPINEIAPFKGILRRNTASTMCTNRPAWRAHECHGYQHEILIIESLDVDSETRRLSPVALLSESYIDLLNGPQDHGWCDGYTCQERLSTFHGIVALNTAYSLFFSGTAPQKLRLRLPNVQSNQSMVLRIFFTTPRRLDIYINNNYIPPLNDHVDASGKHVLKKPTTPTEYRPTISDPTGANFFDRDNQMLHVTIKGNTPIDMYTAPVVVISFGIPPVTPNEFFDSAGLVTRLALFLGVDSSKVRIVDIVRVGSVSGRRKRSTQSSTVSVEVGDPPSTVQTTPAPVTIAPALPPGSTTTTPQPGTTTPSPGAAAIQLLQEFTAKIVNALQTGSLGSQLNTTILSLNVVDPLPPPVTTWTNTANRTTTEPTTNTYSPPDKIQVKQEANAVHTHTPFPIQPKIEAVDAAGTTLSQVGHPTDPWLVTVSVKNKPADVILGGVRSVPFVAGVATFSGLSLNKPGTYELIFQVTYPTTANRFTTTGRAFSIIEKPIPVVPPPDNNKTTLIAIIVGSVVGVLVIIIVAIMVWKGLCSSTSKSAKISCEVGDAGKALPKYTEKMNLNEYVTVQPSTVTSFQSTSKETALDSKSEGPSTTAKTYVDDSVNHPHSTQDIEKSTQTDRRSHTPDSMPPPYDLKE